MRQHRTIALLLALAALLAIPATGTSAPDDQVRGPGCGDIVLSDSSGTGLPAYGGTEGGAATVDSLVTTAKPSCSGVVYTVSLYTDASQTNLIDSRTFNGDDVTSQFPASFSLTNAPHSVCIVATSVRGGHLIDAAPNSGCFPLVINSSGGGSGIN
jgi:hypothetical protein